VCVKTRTRETTYATGIQHLLTGNSFSPLFPAPSKTKPADKRRNVFARIIIPLFSSSSRRRLKFKRTFSWPTTRVLVVAVVVVVVAKVLDVDHVERDDTFHSSRNILQRIQQRFFKNRCCQLVYFFLFRLMMRVYAHHRIIMNSSFPIIIGT